MTPPRAMQKVIYIGNGYLVRQELRYYDAPTSSFVPYTGAASVSLCARSVDSVTGEVTYTPISELGPFVLTTVIPGIYYYNIPTSSVATLNVPLYLNALVYQVVTAAGELNNIQPLLVCPERPPQ